MSFTVKELIDGLNDLDPDLEVRIESEEFLEGFGIKGVALTINKATGVRCVELEPE